MPLHHGLFIASACHATMHDHAMNFLFREQGTNSESLNFMSDKLDYRVECISVIGKRDSTILFFNNTEKPDIEYHSFISMSLESLSRLSLTKFDFLEHLYVGKIFELENLKT